MFGFTMREANRNKHAKLSLPPVALDMYMRGYEILKEIITKLITMSHGREQIN